MVKAWFTCVPTVYIAHFSVRRSGIKTVRAIGDLARSKGNLEMRIACGKLSCSSVVKMKRLFRWTGVERMFGCLILT